MGAKIEGMVVLEGLIEGPVPPFPDAHEKLQKWAAQAAGGRIRISMQVDGVHFSAMPANEPLDVKALGDEPSVVIADALSDLLRLFPPLEKAQVFSTLRSVEWRPKQEVRTMYAVGPDGRPATRQELVACATVAPAVPLSPRELLVRGGTGLVIAAAILGISSLFIDYPKAWRQLTATVEPAKAIVKMGAFAPYFALEVTGIDHKNGVLQVRLTRLPAYPQSEDDLDKLYQNPPEIPPTTTIATTAPATATAPQTAPAYGALRRRLAVEAIARGAVRLEFHDQDGKSIGQTALRTADLLDHQAVETTVPAPIVEDKLTVPSRVDVLP